METKQTTGGADTAKSNVTGEISRSELWNQLQNALSSRSSVDQVYWTSYSIFWATNAVLLVALFSTGKLSTNTWVMIVISTVGLVQLYTWKTIQNRVLGHLERAEALILRIEEDLGLGERHALSVRLSKSDYREFIDKGRSSRFAVKASILFIGISWGLLFIVSVYRFASTLIF
jgi:hypothetical protein